jgi:hypothetical protein
MVIRQSEDSPAGSNVLQFVRLRNNYIMVYGLMMGESDPPAISILLSQISHTHIVYLLSAGDWLQGPYVYALYSFYGFGVKDIGRLFIAGFGSSMVFGTIVGSLADKQ